MFISENLLTSLILHAIFIMSFCLTTTEATKCFVCDCRKADCLRVVLLTNHSACSGKMRPHQQLEIFYEPHKEELSVTTSKATTCRQFIARLQITSFFFGKHDTVTNKYNQIVSVQGCRNMHRNAVCNGKPDPYGRIQRNLPEYQNGCTLYYTIQFPALWKKLSYFQKCKKNCSV